MAMTTAQGSIVLAHYFTNTNHANVGDATGLVASTTPGSFYLSLHTASPTGAEYVFSLRVTQLTARCLK